jgi:hypothetical protein
MPDRRLAPALGLVVVAAGLVPIGAALFADDPGFHAPRWVVGLVGVVIIYGYALGEAEIRARAARGR